MFSTQQETRNFPPQAFFTQSPLTLDKMCVVFDIDDTLQAGVPRDYTYDSTSYLQFVKNTCPEKIISIEFEGKIYDHVLLPGVIETIQYLLKSGCHVALYSGGNPDRNEKFKIELLKRALSPEDFEKYNNQVLVFSVEKQSTKSDAELVSNILGTKSWQKKDLTFVMEAFAKLGIRFSSDQMILIDDDLPWMMKGQEKNFLKVPGCDFYNINCLSQMKKLS